MNENQCLGRTGRTYIRTDSGDTICPTFFKWRGHNKNKLFTLCIFEAPFKTKILSTCNEQIVPVDILIQHLIKTLTYKWDHEK